MKGTILPLSTIPTASCTFLLFCQHTVHLCGQPRSPTAEDQTKSPESNFSSPHVFLALSLLATFSIEHILFHSLS